MNSDKLVSITIIIVSAMMLSIGLQGCNVYNQQLERDKQLHITCMQSGGEAVDTNNGWFSRCVPRNVK